MRLLVCGVGSRFCGLPLAHVVEIMRPLKLATLTNLPRFVAGFAVIRGRPTPVVSARRLLDADATELETAATDARYVSIELGARRAALAVDAVIGVRSVERGQLAELPSLGDEASSGVVLALGLFDRELLFVLERSRLLPQTVWDRLEHERPGS